MLAIQTTACAWECRLQLSSRWRIILPMRLARILFGKALPGFLVGLAEVTFAILVAIFGSMSPSPAASWDFTSACSVSCWRRSVSD